MSRLARYTGRTSWIIQLDLRAYRRITLVMLVLLAAIVMTGSGVRLTGAGLGCPEWPNCEPGSLVPRDATDGHAMVEFVNRVMAVPVGIVAVLAYLGALVRSPRRRDLVWLSFGVLAGVGVQAILGRFLITLHLPPAFVMIHFLSSMVLIAVAVVLFDRAGRPAGARRPVVPHTVVPLGRLLLLVASAVLVAGTVVTGTGPHGGDEGVQRFAFSLPHVARIHGLLALALIAVIVAIVWTLDRHGGAPREVQRRLFVLLIVTLGQAGVGYIQYLNGIPEVLVWLHIGGATAIAASAVWFYLGCFTVEPAAQHVSTRAKPAVARG